MKTRIITIIIGFLVFIPFTEAQNNALEFDGSNDNIITPDLYSVYNNASRTIELWFYANSAGVILNEQGSTILDNNWYDSQIEILSTGEVKVAVWSTIHEIVSTGFVNFNTWNHIALCYDNSSHLVYGYLNGIKSGTRSATISMPSTNQLYYRLAAGTATNMGSGAFFNGKLDEIRFWNDVRSETEIRQNMYQELTNPTGESNLLAYYKLNESSGSIADNAEGTAGYDGTLFNMDNIDWVTSPALFGPKNCLELDGNDNVGAFNPAPVFSNTEMTIEAWIKTSSNSIQNILSWGNTGNSSNIQFRTNNGKLEFGTDPVGSWQSVISSDNVNTNNWVHVAVTKTSNNLTLYVNGNEDGTAVTTNNMSVNAFDIGKYWGVGYFFTGSIDEVRIWNDIRSESEIKENMCKSLTGNEQGLTAYYNFDHSSGNYLADFAGSDNDGTAFGGDPSWSSSQAFNIWLNTISTNAATSTNWSRGSAPTTSDNVGIYNFSGSDPLVTTTFDCNHLFLESGASLTLSDGASFINAGNLFIDGNFTFNKTLTSDSKWHLVSIPNNNTTANHFYGDFLQTWNESTGLWEDISDETTPLVPVKSYAFWGTQSKATYSFTGEPNSGNQSIALTANGAGGSYNNANAVGNPYASAIDWDQVSGYGAKYTWNGTAYEAYTSVGGYDLGPRYAAPFQGFIVVPESAGTFTLTNEDRTHTGADGFEKSENDLKKGIVLFAYNGSYKDKLLVNFIEDASSEFEQDKDAWKILSNTVGLAQLYSLENGNKLSIDSRPFEEMIQLGFQNDVAGNYIIELEETNGINEVELEDTKLNQFHDLSNGAYQFVWNTTDSEERFILHLKATGTNDMEEQDVQVYSANGQLYIRMNQSDTFDQLIIYDVAGRVITEKTIQAYEIQSFDLSHLKGTYLVQLKSSTNSITKKIIIN